MKMRELFSGPETWTQGYYAETADGQYTDYNAPDATRWCLYGACDRCYGRGQEGIEVIMDKLNTGVVKWNDSPFRKFEDVKALVEELDL